MESKGLPRELRDQLIKSARGMRSNPTGAEFMLWKLLRKRQLGGFKFRRQYIIHTFIVDFYCPSARLVIEVDGEIHERQKGNDIERDAVLQALDTASSDLATTKSSTI